MLAYTYPLLDLFGTMLGLFIFIIWFWLLIVVFSDIFRSKDMGGWAKGIWVIFVIILPFLGILVYLIARGGKMHERAEQAAKQQQAAFDDYVRQAAGTGSVAEQIKQLADLKDAGTISQAEFDAQKAKLLGT